MNTRPLGHAMRKVTWQQWGMIAFVTVLTVWGLYLALTT